MCIRDSTTRCRSKSLRQFEGSATPKISYRRVTENPESVTDDWVLGSRLPLAADGLQGVGPVEQAEGEDDMRVDDPAAAPLVAHHDAKGGEERLPHGGGAFEERVVL
eukprot:3923412-Pyramimonas_sp.AAC.1